MRVHILAAKPVPTKKLVVVVSQGPTAMKLDPRIELFLGVSWSTRFRVLPVGSNSLVCYVLWSFSTSSLVKFGEAINAVQRLA
jgi:hypothetical protein